MRFRWRIKRHSNCFQEGRLPVCSSLSRREWKSIWGRWSRTVLRIWWPWMPCIVPGLWSISRILSSVSTGRLLSSTITRWWSLTWRTRMVLPFTKSRWCYSPAHWVILPGVCRILFVRQWVRNRLTRWTSWRRSSSRGVIKTRSSWRDARRWGRRSTRWLIRFGETGRHLHRTRSTNRIRFATLILLTRRDFWKLIILPSLWRPTWVVTCHRLRRLRFSWTSVSEWGWACWLRMWTSRMMISRWTTREIFVSGWPESRELARLPYTRLSGNGMLTGGTKIFSISSSVWITRRWTRRRWKIWLPREGWIVSGWIGRSISICLTVTRHFLKIWWITGRKSNRIVWWCRRRCLGGWMNMTWKSLPFLCVNLGRTWRRRVKRRNWSVYT